MGRQRDIRNDVGASGNGLLARLAVPDSDRVASNSGLSAERTDVLGVLCDFHLLDLLTEGSTVSVRSEQSAPALLSSFLTSSNCADVGRYSEWCALQFVGPSPESRR